MSDEKSGQNDYDQLWTTVTKELAKNDMSANKVAVLETEKIFQKALSDRNLPGKDTDDRIKNYAYLFSNPDKLRYARAMYKKLITKTDFDINAEDAREIINGYHEAIIDLEKVDFRSWAIKDKVSLFLKRNFYSFPEKIKQAAFVLLLLSALTFIITETETGRSVSAGLVSANNYFFYRVIPAIAMAFATGILALGILYAYQKKKK
jgi:hypothetical protein